MCQRVADCHTTMTVNLNLTAACQHGDYFLTAQSAETQSPSCLEAILQQRDEIYHRFRTCHDSSHSKSQKQTSQETKWTQALDIYRLLRTIQRYQTTDIIIGLRNVSVTDDMEQHWLVIHIPVSIRESQSLPAFKHHLKTFYFQSAYLFFSCPPCLEYLPPCTLILLRRCHYLSHVLTQVILCTSDHTNSNTRKPHHCNHRHHPLSSSSSSSTYDHIIKPLFYHTVTRPILTNTASKQLHAQAIKSDVGKRFTHSNTRLTPH